MVTNLVGANILFDDNWYIEELNDELIFEQLSKQKESRNTLLAYSWGVFCTAYARRRLWLEGLVPLNRDIVYTDTDSVKYFGNHEEHFKKMNDNIINTLLNCDLPQDLIPKLHPKDPSGKEHWLGLWDDEGVCDLITQGSKKYATLHDGELGVTVAGLSKKKAITNPYLKTLNDFKKGLKFETEQSGRMIAYYLDNQPPVNIDGHAMYYRYGLALQPTTYTLGRGRDYDNFLASESIQYEREVIDRWMKS